MNTSRALPKLFNLFRILTTLAMLFSQFAAGITRVKAAAPGDFNKTAPLDAATLQSPVGLSLSWGTSLDAVSYEYCIDTVSGTSCDTGWVSTGTNISITLDLSSGTTYYWQVRAINDPNITEADAGAWWSFTTKVKVGLITDIGGVADNSFNQMAYQGLLQAETDLGVYGTVYESVSADDYPTNLQQCVTDGNELCISVGFPLRIATALVAKANPSINFAIVDYSYPDCNVGDIEGENCGSFTDIPNVRGLTFNSKQAGYLAGSLAGLMTTSNVIGTVGGRDIPPVTSFIEGYHNGAQCANPDVNVLINYTNDFANPALGAATAQLLMTQGADVIFNVAGPTGEGAILYAAQNGAWAIGVDTDQYMNVFGNGSVDGHDKILTSAMKRVDTAVYDTISDVVAGTFTSGTVIYNLPGDGVGLAPYHETDGVIPAETKAYVDAVKAGIIAGTTNIDETCRLSQDVTLWYSYGTGSGEENALMQVIANAEAADPDLDIVPTWHDFNTLFSDYEAAVTAGGGPDMFIAPNDNLGSEVRAGAILDIDSLLTGKLTGVNTAAVDGMKVDGKLYGVPESAKAVALYYNTSTVPTPPTTTAGLLALLQAGKKLAAPGGAAYFLYGFWHAFGGQLMDETGYCTADQGGFTEAMQYFLDLQTAGASLLTSGNTGRDSFVNGDVDMYISGPWELADLEGVMGANLGVVLLPAGPVAAATPMNGIDGFYVNPTSPHPAEDVEVALFMVNQASSQIFTDWGGHIPVRSDVTSADPLKNTFALASAAGEPRPQNAQINNYWGPFGGMFDGVLGGSTTPLDGVAAACRQMNELNGFRTFYLKASAAADWVHAYGWPDGTQLTLKVGDPDTPDYTTTTNAGAAPWDTLSPVPDIVGMFDLNTYYDLQPGDELTVSGAGHTVTSTVPAAMTQVRWFIGLGTGAEASQIPIEQQVVDDYNTAHAEIELLLEVVPNDQAVSILSGEIASLNGPDVIGPMGWSTSNSFYGQYLDLDPLITSTGFNTSIFNPALVGMYQTEEGQVSLPFAVYPSMVYYNPALFDAAGLNYPPAAYGEQYLMPDDVTLVDWNWGTVSQVAKLLTLDNTGKNATQPGFDSNNIVQYGFSFGWEGHPNYWGSFWQAGSLVQGSGPSSYLAVVPAAWQEAWQWVYDGMWGDQPYIPNGPVSGNLDGGNVFASGKVAMLENPNWYLCCMDDLINAGGTFQFGAMPIYNGAVAGRMDADTFRIWQGTSNPDEAFDVLAYLVTDGVDKLIVGSPYQPGAIGAIPAITTKQQPFLNAKAAQFPFVTPASWDVMVAGLDYPDMPNAEAWMPHFTDAWSRLQNFADKLSGSSNFSVPVQTTILEDDLTAIFNGEPLPIHPYMQVNPAGHWMHGYGWPTGTHILLTVERGDPLAVIYQAEAVMEQAPWNPGDPNDILANFNLWNPEVDLQNGDVITMVDEGLTATASMTVWTFGVIASDAELNTVSGIADTTHGLVHIWVNGPGWDQWVPVSAGLWTADFSLNDLTAGMNGGAEQTDGYGNQLQADWRVQRPWIQAGVTGRWVQAHEWPRYAELTMTINGLGDYHATVGLSNPAGDPFDTWAQFNGVTLQAGDVILITDGVNSKSYTVTNLQVLSAEPGTYIVSGLADDGAQVQVCVNIPNDCIQRWVTPSGGAWLVDYSSTSDPSDSRTHLLVAGDNGWAAQYNEVGDQTWVDWRIPNPHIEAWPKNHNVQAREWPIGTTIHMTIERTGLDPYEADATMIQAPWNPDDPNDVVAQFNLWGPQYDLQPGDVITMAGGGKSTSLTVSALTVTGVDVDANTISGTAVAGEGEVRVWINNGPEVIAPVDELGNWTANFFTDITPGMNGGARQTDSLGSYTQWDWRALRPWIQAGVTSNWVQAREWPLGANLTMTVNAGDPQFSTVTLGNPFGDPFDTWAQFNGVTLAAGDVVLITDGVTPKSYTVTNLQVTGFDEVAETISGLASPGAQVQVCANIPNNCISQWVSADGVTGAWTADYTGLFDLQPGSNGWVSEPNTVGDQTWVDWYIPNPHIEANPVSHWVFAREWPLNTWVTMTITGSGGTYSDTAQIIHNPDNPGDPNDIRAYFNLWTRPYDLQPGDGISMEGGGITRSMTVMALNVSVLDTDNDLVSGTGVEGAPIHVWVNGGPNLNFTVGSGGNWTADFSPYDLKPGMDGGAQEYDSAGNLTQFDWRIPNPNFTVRANEDMVEGWEWNLGDTLTVKIWDDSDIVHSPDYETTRTVGVFEKDPNQTYAYFGLAGQFDILPGNWISLSDGITTKWLTVSSLAFTNVDVDADIVYGVADIDVRVDVWACDYSGCYNRHAYSDPVNGQWSVNFSVLGSEGNEQVIYDLENGTWIDSNQSDGDGDSTMYGITVSLPYIEASVGSHWVHARGSWPEAAIITMTIHDPLGSDYGPVTATFGQNPGNPGDPNDRLADFDLASYQLQPGQIITMTTGEGESLIIKGYTIQPLEVTGIDLAAETISGTGVPDHQLQVCVNNMNDNCSRHISVAGDNSWVADYGNPSPTRSDEQATTNLVPGSNGWVADYEDDGDRTWVDWNVPVTGHPTTLTKAAAGEPITFDPALAYDTASGEVIQNVYETLVFYDGAEPDAFMPQLADSYGLSPDGLTWTFHIRPGVTFHNAASLTPTDVAYSLQRGLLQGGSGSPQFLFAEPILGIGIQDISQVVDPLGSLLDNRAALQAWDPADLMAACNQVRAAIVADEGAGTVTIHLAQKWGPFLATLANIWGSILDRDWTIAQGGWDGSCGTWQNFYAMSAEEDPLTTVTNGTGPFKLDHWTRGIEVVLARNDDYWRTPAQQARVEIWNIPNGNARFDLLANGSADLSVSPDRIGELDVMVGEDCIWNAITDEFDCSVVDVGQPLRRYLGQPVIFQNAVLFNFDITIPEGGNPYIGSGQLDGAGVPPDFFSDVHIRKAFSYAFDWDAFNNQRYGGSAVRSLTLALEGMPGYDPGAPFYNFDLALAEAEFKLADLDHDGIPAGEETDGGDVWFKGFQLQMPYPEGNPTRQAVAEILAARVQAVNSSFVLDAVSLSGADFQVARLTRQVPVMTGGWIEDIHDPHNWYPTYLVGYYANLSHFPEDLKAQFQSLINQGVTENDFSSRDTTYKQLNQMIYDNATFFTLDRPGSHDFMQQKINGLVRNPIFPGTYFYTLVEGSAILSVSDGMVLPGSSGTITVSLDNQETEAATGAEVWLVYDSTIGITLTGVNVTGRTAGFSTSYALDSSNPAAVTAHVLLFTLSDATITPGSGPILDISFDVAESATSGATSPLSFSNANLSNAFGNPIRPVNYSDTGTFTVQCRTGDVTCDGNVNVFDLQNQINMILNIPQPDENLRPLDWWTRADLLKDGVWNVFDLQRLINIIMGRSGLSPEMMKALSTGVNQLNVETIQSPPGTSGSLGILLDNEDPVASGELWLSYDSTNGLDITGVETTSRTSGFTTDFSKDASDPSQVKLHVLYFNLSGTTIAAGSGSILGLNFTLAADASGTNTVHLGNGLLANSMGDPLPTDITQNVPLVSGWNLVSFRVHPTSTLIADVLSSLGSNFDLVYAWDATGGHAGAGHWMRYAPGIPGNTLETLSENQGFWIRMTTDDILEITGTPPTTTYISLSTLASGWNLVGYPTDDNLGMPVALSEHGISDYSLVYGYHAEDVDNWKRYAPGVPGNDLLELEHSWGYWIKVSTPGTWHVEY